MGKKSNKIKFLKSNTLQIELTEQNDLHIFL